MIFITLHHLKEQTNTLNKQSSFKVLSITIGLLIGLFIAEVGYRVYHFISFHSLDDIKVGRRESVIAPNEEKTLGQIIQLAKKRKIIYELIPNSIYKFQDVVVETNDQGFRDKNYPSEKAKHTSRVIGLGDSVMFGWGVDEEDCFLSRLEQQLNEEGSKKYEVINTAVPGYNSVMEIEVLKTKFDLSQINYVILNFVVNDFDLPNFIQRQPKYFTIKKSFILQQFDDIKGLDRRLDHAPFDLENLRFQRDSSKVPGEYRDMVGAKSCLNAFKQLQELKNEFKFKVIVLSHSPYYTLPESIERACDTYGFELIDAKPYWEAYKQKHPTAEWKLSKDDFHPSSEGHKVISEVLVEKFKYFEVIESVLSN